MYLIDTRKYDDSFLLAKILEKVDFTDEETKKLFIHFEIPAVDAVEVVRCKDCKWYKESNHSELYPVRFCYRLKNDDGVPVGYNWADNDFCSYGERRDKKTASYYGDNKLIETVVIDEREKDEAD